jgi:hypothetical protein
MPEASFQDLQTAINGFNNQVQNYAIQSAVSSASQQVQQLQGAQMDEMQRRQSAQQLSNQLALQLSGLGATGAQIHGAFSAIAPKELPNANAMNAEALMKNSPSLAGAAKKQQTFENENKLALMQLQMQMKSQQAEQKKMLMLDDKYAKAVEQSQVLYNKDIKESDQNLFKAGLLTDIVQSGNVTALQNMAGLIRRQMGDVGPMTEVEQRKVEELNTLSGKVDSLVQYAKGGSPITPKVRQNIQDLEQKLIKANTKFKELMLRKHAYQLVKKARLRGHNIDLNYAASELANMGGSSLEGGGGSAPTNSSGGIDASLFFSTGK